MSTLGDIDIKDWDNNSHITLKEIQENEDGSVDCQLNVSALGLQLLLNYAVVGILKEAIEEGKKYTPSELWRKRK